MNARFMAAGAVLGLILAVLVFAPPSAAQVEGGKGAFSELKVGQMIEMHNDPTVGLIVRYYDEPTADEKLKMAYKIIEVEREYIALEFQDARTDLEMRYPATAVAGVCHIKKKPGVKPAPKKKTTTN